MFSLVSLAKILGCRTGFRLFLRVFGEAVCQKELSIAEMEGDVAKSIDSNRPCQSVLL